MDLTLFFQPLHQLAAAAAVQAAQPMQEAVDLEEARRTSFWLLGLLEPEHLDKDITAGAIQEQMPQLIP
jgi:hypothetical protein